MLDADPCSTFRFCDILRLLVRMMYRGYLFFKASQWLGRGNLNYIRDVKNILQACGPIAEKGCRQARGKPTLGTERCIIAV
jgi:hypothetical protein